MAIIKNQQHKIVVSGKLGADIYKDRVKRDTESSVSLALMAGDYILDDEDSQIKGVASLLNQMSGDVIINHPKNALKFIINKNIDAKQCYLLSCGAYIPNMLDAILEHLPAGAKTIDIGAGIGISTIVAAQVAGKSVLAIEPNANLHRAIHKNADINKATISLIQGCVVVGEQAGDTSFHISAEPWTSSIFAENSEDVVESIKVPIVNINKLITEHKINSIIIDIHGAELGLFDVTDLSCIDCLIITIDSKTIGEKATASVIAAIARQGLELKDIKGWTFIFKR